MPRSFEESAKDRAVANDMRTLKDFTVIFCDGHHRTSLREPVATDAARLGVYGKRPPVLCEQCAAHLAYGERRRAFCPKDPKPFCANCDVHCYRNEEREWQRQMMRYSGPRSVLHGHAIDGIRHVLETRRHRRAAEKE